jgi:hypothetical protein
MEYSLKIPYLEVSVAPSILQNFICLTPQVAKLMGSCGLDFTTKIFLFIYNFLKNQTLSQRPKKLQIVTGNCLP